MNAEATKMTPVQRFWGLLKPDSKEITQLYIYSIFNGLVSLSLPLGIQAIINLIQGGQMSTSWTVLVAIVIMGIAFSGILQIMQLRITENLQQKIFTRAAFEFAYRIPRFKLEAIYNHYAPELMNRFFDALAVQKGLSKILLDFSTASLQVVFGLILLSLYHPIFIMFSVILLILIAAIFQFTGKRGLETSLKESKYKYQIAHWLEELARTNFSFKLAGKTSLPINRTNEMLENYLGAREGHFNVLKQQFILLVMFKVIVAAGLLVLGGVLVMEQELNIGQFVAAELIILYVMSSVEKLIVNLVDLYDVLTALEKIGQVVDLDLEKSDGADIPKEGHQHGMHVQIEDVYFRYPDMENNILNGLQLSIAPGEKLTITGKNGSGKSTLLSILAGLYTPQRGAISYDKLPIGNLNIETLRNDIGACLTEEKLFNGTLAENIGLGRQQINFADIQHAANLMGLSEFVRKQAKGFDTEIDPEGQKLPRSTVQKILLARSISNKPRLLLLEDAFEHIEEKEQRQMIDALTGDDAPWTLISVSNNKYMAQRSTRVAVLENGMVSACAPFDELELNTD
ncbi:MAG: hypothetical protein ABR95_11050 [Sphingobacteriales bacterium BACL12 MAG-120813-bin55]|jgi:ABC-type bacteriocin/lantibiotic exporter with double-glycine peptidase domain|nr:MAG: hypothetical protein ABR95_11050 [Sphingobacteriales bacterium BACL12 MAG-120813-bin55]